MKLKILLICIICLTSFDVLSNSSKVTISLKSTSFKDNTKTEIKICNKDREGFFYIISVEALIKSFSQDSSYWYEFIDNIDKKYIPISLQNDSIVNYTQSNEKSTFIPTVDLIGNGYCKKNSIMKKKVFLNFGIGCYRLVLNILNSNGLIIKKINSSEFSLIQ